MYGLLQPLVMIESDNDKPKKPAKPIPLPAASKALAEPEFKKVSVLINRYVFLLLVIVFGLMLFISLSQFFTAFLGATIFYILSRRRMDKLVKRRWKKPIAAAFIIFLSIIIIMVPIIVMGYLLYSRGKFYIAHPEALVESLKKVQVQLQENYNIGFISDKNIAEIQAYASQAIRMALNESLDFLATISMLYFFYYFMLISVNRMEAAIVLYLPFKRSKVEMFSKELVALTFSNSIGVPAIAIAQGLIGYIAYYIVGLPEAGFWAIMTAFSSIIPLVGTALVFVPAAIYMLFIHQTWQGVFLFAWGVFVLGITDNVVRLVLARKMADVHPVVTILGVIMGLKYFGISGIVFGPVLISFFIISLKIYYAEFQQKGYVPATKKARPIRLNFPFLRPSLRRKKRTHANNRNKVR
jgi:predicted PurR-regulated permease PerM